MNCAQTACSCLDSPATATHPAQMLETEFTKAVRSVLAALNLEPTSFAPPPGFIARARRLGEPRSLVLSGSGSGLKLLVHAGTVVADRPDSAQTWALDRVLALLPAKVLTGQQFIVAWDDGAAAYAAAFERRGAITTEQLAGSWIASGDWSRPKIDANLPRALVLDDALRTLRDLLMAPKADERRITNAWALLGQALQRIGGEPLHGEPPKASPASERERWLAHVERAVVDERRRLGLAHAESLMSAAPALATRTEPETLAGTRVFVSYARPDATQLAWPAVDLLRSLGADVWMDQECLPSAAELDDGMADTIASCDVFLLCATDELFERASYAAQELAWALGHAGAGRLRTAVVAAEHVALPSAVHHWPRIDWRDEPAAERAARFLEALRTGVKNRLLPVAPTLSRDTWPPLARRTDPAGAALRCAAFMSCECASSWAKMCPIASRPAGSVCSASPMALAGAAASRKLAKAAPIH